MEQQIQALQTELRHMKQESLARHREIQAAHQAATAQAKTAQAAILAPPALPQIPPGYALVPAAPGSVPGSVVLAQIAAPQTPPLPSGSFKLGNVSVTLGGFIEAAGIARSRNETADIASNFNTGIPLPNSPNYHQGEFRFSARQTRFSVLAQASPDEHTKLAAFAEFDLLGAAPTANSVESNSYNPRLRHAYAAYDRTDWDFYVLAGQTWSLLTMNKKGIGYLNAAVNPPLSIDLNYIPGFTWARQPQIRVEKSFAADRFALAASLETPQTTFYTGPNRLLPASSGTVTVVNDGGLGYAPTVTYSDNQLPDMIVKAAFDPLFGHFEAYGIARRFHDRLSTLGDGSNKDSWAGGGGAAALVHLIPKYLDIQGSFLAGEGIGRYSSASLPDAVVGPNGQPESLSELQALVGVIAHPLPPLDLYAYAGREQTSRKQFTALVDGKPTGFGYGSPLYPTSSCGVELGAAADCVANTSAVTQITAGGWWRLVHGDYGTMQVGTQYAYTHRSIFPGIGPTPKTDENTVLLSFRYYPFQ
jgi:hypothetical protein